jgi:hypothetical protein
VIILEILGGLLVALAIGLGVKYAAEWYVRISKREEVSGDSSEETVSTRTAGDHDEVHR